MGCEPIWHQIIPIILLAPECTVIKNYLLFAGYLKALRCQQFNYLTAIIINFLD